MIDISYIIDQNLFNIQEDVVSLEHKYIDDNIRLLTEEYIAAEAECFRLLQIDNLTRIFNENYTTLDLFDDDEVVILESANGSGDESLLDRFIAFLKSLFHFLTLGIFQEKKIEDSVKDLSDTPVSEKEKESIEKVLDSNEFQENLDLLEENERMNEELKGIFVGLTDGKEKSKEEVDESISKIKELSNNIKDNFNKIVNNNNKIKSTKAQVKSSGNSNNSSNTSNNSENNKKSIADGINSEEFKVLLNEDSVNKLLKILGTDNRDLRKVSAEHKEILNKVSGLKEFYKKGGKMDDLSAKFPELLKLIPMVKDAETKIQKAKVETLKSVVDVKEVKLSKKAKKQRRKQADVLKKLNIQNKKQAEAAAERSDRIKNKAQESLAKKKQIRQQNEEREKAEEDHYNNIYNMMHG